MRVRNTMSAATPPSGPPSPAPVQGTRPAATAVTGAIRKASQSTGASFDYLLATAKVESDLNPNLTMRSSSATGLFQFIDQTWLGVMQSAGRAFGYGKYADAITQTPSGQFVVQDPALRNEIMRLRKDPAANAAMGGVFTQQNAALVKKRIGRQPTDGELYVAHFFGPYAGAKVIGMAKTDPHANAAQMFPAAAAANRPIFYDKQGNARSVSGVYNELVRRYQVAKARPTPGPDSAVADASSAPGTTLASNTPVASPASLPPPSSATPVVPTTATTAPAPVRVAASARIAPTVPDTAGITAAFAAAEVTPVSPASDPSLPDEITRREPPAAFRPVNHSPSAPAFHRLFETEGPRGPISPAVAQLWGGGGAAGGSAARDGEQEPPLLPTPGLPPDTLSGGPGEPLDLLKEMRSTLRRQIDGRS
jgi:hypothetical protein